MKIYKYNIYWKMCKGMKITQGYTLFLIKKYEMTIIIFYWKKCEMTFIISTLLYDFKSTYSTTMVNHEFLSTIENVTRKYL